MLPKMLPLDVLKAACAAGTKPLEVAEQVIARRRALADRAVFITETPEDALRDMARAVGTMDPALLPWGLPFALKDNIDVAGLPTTTACPAFAYQPGVDATVVSKLNARMQVVAPVWEAAGVLMLPTAPTTCTVATMLAELVKPNSEFGR